MLKYTMKQMIILYSDKIVYNKDNEIITKKIIQKL